MTSEMQISANKANAQKSTGPTTAVGKAKASQNAIKHGLLSHDLLINDEKQQDLKLFRKMIYETLCPVGAVEELLVEKIINAIWRLRRLTTAESEFFGSDSASFKKRINQVFYGNSGNCLNILSRYESTLERSFYRAVHELQRIQAMRLGHPMLAPVAIEINSNADPAEIGFVS